jgi:hypothetical protein
VVLERLKYLDGTNTQEMSTYESMYRLGKSLDNVKYGLYTSIFMVEVRYFL